MVTEEVNKSGNVISSTAKTTLLNSPMCILCNICQTACFLWILLNVNNYPFGESKNLLDQWFVGEIKHVAAIPTPYCSILMGMRNLVVDISLKVKSLGVLRVALETKENGSNTRPIHPLLPGAKWLMDTAVKLTLSLLFQAVPWQAFGCHTATEQQGAL